MKKIQEKNKETKKAAEDKAAAVDQKPKKKCKCKKSREEVTPLPNKTEDSKPEETQKGESKTTEGAVKSPRRKTV